MQQEQRLIQLQQLLLATYKSTNLRDTGKKTTSAACTYTALCPALHESETDEDDPYHQQLLHASNQISACLGLSCPKAHACTTFGRLRKHIVVRSMCVFPSWHGFSESTSTWIVLLAAPY
mmetsp:Transcript_19976/g.43519  ORF Transcript_19976/g.43519 Transcript_19976/m.43519 type:complete len:120 (-) Transcript_19976:1094-1453(-)